MRPQPGGLQLLDHEPPAGRPLQRELRLARGEPRTPLPDSRTRHRTDPPIAHLAALQIERLRRDLTAMNIKSTYDLHRDLLELRRLKRHRVGTTLEPRRSHYMSSFGPAWQFPSITRRKTVRRPSAVGSRGATCRRRR